MRRITITAITLGISMVLLAGCTSQANTAASKASQVVTVTRGDIKINITAAGNLVSAHDAKLTFGSSGKVTDVNVGIGDAVTEGAVLAQLETPALERAVVQARLNLKQSQMNLENAKDPKTTSSGTSVPDPLDIEIKEFDLQAKKLELADAELNLKNATIIAPFAGLIAELNVNPGDKSDGVATAIRLIDPAKFKVTVLVNEADINKVNVGANATIQVDAVRSIVYPARVAHIYPVGTITSNVVNFKVEVELNAESLSASGQDSTPPAQNTSGQGATQRNPPSGQTGQSSQSGQRTQRPQQTAAAAAIPAGFQLREGQTVLLSVTVDQATDVLLLPNLALSTRGGRTYVQVVNAAGTTEERAVQTGISDGQNTQILNGLQDKDQVAIIQAAATSTTTPASKQQQPPGGIGGLNRILK